MINYSFKPLGVWHFKIKDVSAFTLEWNLIHISTTTIWKQHANATDCQIWKWTAHLGDSTVMFIDSDSMLSPWKMSHRFFFFLIMIWLQASAYNSSRNCHMTEHIGKHWTWLCLEVVMADAGCRCPMWQVWLFVFVNGQLVHRFKCYCHKEMLDKMISFSFVDDGHLKHLYLDLRPLEQISSRLPFRYCISLSKEPRSANKTIRPHL